MKVISLEGEVINPNSKPFQTRVDKALRIGFPVMDVFAQTIRDTADAVCFRRFKDGKLGAGVAREVLEGIIWGLPIWEILEIDSHHDFSVTAKQPVQLGRINFSEVLSVEETRERIAKGEL